VARACEFRWTRDIFKRNPPFVAPSLSVLIWTTVLDPKSRQPVETAASLTRKAETAIYNDMINKAVSVSILWQIKGMTVNRIITKRTAVIATRQLDGHVIAADTHQSKSGHLRDTKRIFDAWSRTTCENVARDLSNSGLAGAGA
jgi:hypothetical protein